MTQKELAEKWGTTQMNVSNMMRAGCDFEASDVDVAKWIKANAKRKSKALTASVNAVLKPGAGHVPDNKEKRSLEEMRDYYASNLDEVTRQEDFDKEGIKFWNDLLLKADESIRKSEAHAKKLGVDKGELLGKEEVERILRAMTWAGNACLDKFSKQIAQRLSNKSPQQVHEILAPTLTALTLFEGMKKVAKPPGEVNVPQWVIDCMNTEEKQYIEYGDAATD